MLPLESTAIGAAEEAQQEYVNCPLKTFTCENVTPPSPERVKLMLCPVLKLYPRHSTLIPPLESTTKNIFLLPPMASSAVICLGAVNVFPPSVERLNST